MTRALLLVVLAAGCTNYRTQIMVGILTDFVLPSDLPSGKSFMFRFGAERNGVPLFRSCRCITSEAEIPGSLGIYSTTSIDAEVDLALEAYQVDQGGQMGCDIDCDPNVKPFASRKSTLSVLADQTLFYRMALVASCKDKTCGADETCIEGFCRPRAVDSDTLPKYIITRPKMESTVHCDSGTNYVSTRTGLNVPRSVPFGCAADEECIEATCYKRPPGADLGVAGPDLSSDVDLAQSSCVPTTCAAIGASCGTRNDGCGRVLVCGPPCQVGMFTSGGNVTPGRTAFSVLQTPRRIFLFGGEDDTLKATASVQQADINANGTITTFTDNGRMLSSPRESTAALIVGPYVYVTGGETNNGVTPPKSENVVERATLDMMGNLGPFVSIDVLNTPRDSHVMLAVGQWLYVIGGEDSNLAPLRSIERALIRADGTIGQFMPAGTLVVPRVAAAGVVTEKYLYILGGSGGKDRQLDSIERAPVGADGTLGPFADTGRKLAAPRGGAGVVVLGNDIYLLGGRSVAPGGTGGVFVTSLEQAAIQVDGTLSAFTPIGISLGAPRGGHGVAASGNALYVIGGITDGPAILNSIERAPLQ